MILLLGASGYMGRAFASELRRRGCSFIPLTRKAYDYTRFDFLFDYLRTMKPVFLINAAGRSGWSNGDGCESAREEALWANSLLPQMIARVCLMTRTPWGHVSSGSIYTGAKVVENGKIRIEKDLGRREARRLFDAQPEKFYGFTEVDEPNFSFRNSPCSFFSGTKALAEEAIRDIGQSYLWRLRMPFNERDETSNLLSRFQQNGRIYDAVDSLSHLEDCVQACLDLWERRAPYGIYNVTNPGVMTGRQMADSMERLLKTDRHFECMESEEENRRDGSKAPQSHCILDVAKMLGTGIKMRSVGEVWEDSLVRSRLGARTPKVFVPVAVPLPNV